MRHKLLVLTVKKFLQSVYIYGSYRKIKTGVPFFLDHPVLNSAQRSTLSTTTVSWRSSVTGSPLTVQRWTGFGHTHRPICQLSAAINFANEVVYIAEFLPSTL